MSSSIEPLIAITTEMRAAARASFASKLVAEYEATGRLDEAPAAQALKDDDDYIASLASRIEAAARNADAECRKNEEAAFRRGQASVANAAAMFEALLKARNTLVLYSRDMKPQYQTEIDLMIDICDSLLSTSVRNCDRFNSGDPTKDAANAYDEWQRYCDESSIPPSCKVESAFKQWLFAPVKSETKGDSNGSK